MESWKLHLSQTIDKDIDPFINLLLQDRYLIYQYFSEGFYGRLFRAKDLKQAKSDVLIKISSDLEKSKHEYEIMKKVMKT